VDTPSEISPPVARGTLVLVTGNRSKLAEAQRLTAGSGRTLEAVALDLPEIQSLDMEAVLRLKAAHAWQAEQRPVIVEETGLELRGMNGFPGPLVKWMLEAVGAEGIARTALALGDAHARAVCLLLWTDGRESLLGRGEAEGELVLPARGANGFGWDPVFRPAGTEQTYAELGEDEKDRIGHRGQAWRDLLSRLEAGRATQ
jgi:non-canonical purine NTP pyrophosphatase (RdgB/HAM1 family)